MEQVRKTLAVVFFISVLTSTLAFTGQVNATGEGIIVIEGTGEVVIYGNGEIILSSNNGLFSIDYTDIEGKNIEVNAASIEKGYNFDGTFKLNGDSIHLIFTGKCMNMKFVGRGELTFEGEGFYEESGVDHQWSDEERKIYIGN